MEAVTAEIPQEELVEGLKAGDESSVTAFVDAYWAPGYRMALRMCGGDSAAAEDVAGKALLNALRGVHTLGPGRALRPWFFRIVGNAAREQQRGAKRRARHERRAQASTPVAVTTEAAMSKQEELDTVRRHVDQLPEHYRAAISLRFLEGLSLREVAESLGCREGTVSSRIRRGLAALRRSLGPALATSLLLLLPQVAQADEVPPPPPAAELLAARGPLIPARPAPRVPAFVLGVAFVALLAGGLVNALVPKADRPQLAETSGAQPVDPARAQPVGPGGGALETGAGSFPDLGAKALIDDPEPAELDPDVAPIGSSGIFGPAVPMIRARVLGPRKDGGLVSLDVGSDEQVKRGYQFTIHRGKTSVAIVVVERLRRDSCDCRVFILRPGEAIASGDEASTKFE